MKSKLGVFSILLILGSEACNDLPPDVIIIEDPEPPRERLDQFYHVQFQWGKPRDKDTVTIEVPDDTATLAASNTWDPIKDYYNFAIELRNEVIEDTTDWLILDPPYPKIGWHYAPASTFISRRAFVAGTKSSAGTGEQQEALKGVFTFIFPWKVKNDTIQFWDMADYMSNPSIRLGDIPWGRMGNQEYQYRNPDTLMTLWNNDAYTGVEVRYTDTSGVMWSSAFPPTFQTGPPPSYFIIDKIYPNDRDKNLKPDQNFSHTSYSIVEGRFSARLYNEWGDMKMLDGGRFRMKIYSDIELAPQPE